MAGLVLFLFAVAAAASLRRYVSRRAVHVHDDEGRHVVPGAALGWRTLGIAAALLALLLMLATSVRVVPVGHALVIFNTVTRSFRVGRHGRPRRTRRWRRSPWRRETDRGRSNMHAPRSESVAMPYVRIRTWRSSCPLRG